MTDRKEQTGMWPFKRSKTLEESGFFQGFTEWHCHLLPGVDDGVQTMEDSLCILSEYERLGIGEVWLTPHVMEDMPNTTKGLRKCFAALQQAYTGSMRLHIASENMLDSLFEERLAANDFLPIGKEKDHLLVETSYFNPPMNLYVLLDEVRQKGYYPLLAHPERYVYMGMADYATLKQQGVRFQLNLPSLAGMYGRHVQQKAEKLLHKHLYDYVGMDIHAWRNVEWMKEQKIERSLLNICKIDLCRKEK